MDPINEIELEDCPVCRGAGYIEDEQGWCMYACCLNCGTETAHVSYKTPEERLEAARQAAYLWNIGKVIHNGMCDLFPRKKRASERTCAFFLWLIQYRKKLPGGTQYDS